MTGEDRSRCDAIDYMEMCSLAHAVTKYAQDHLRHKQGLVICQDVQLTAVLDAFTSSSDSAAVASTPNPSLWISSGTLVRLLFCFCHLGGSSFPSSLWEFALPAGFCLVPTAAGCFLHWQPLRCCLAGAFGRNGSCCFNWHLSWVVKIRQTDRHTLIHTHCNKPLPQMQHRLLSISSCASIVCIINMTAVSVFTAG